MHLQIFIWKYAVQSCVLNSVCIADSSYNRYQQDPTFES